MSAHSPVHAVLLAAGQGKRLGYPKAALQVGGKWMLPELVRNLRIGGASRVSLVLSSLALDTIADLGHPDADDEVIHAHPERGRTSSLQAALPLVQPGHALLIHNCDIPLLRADVIHRLIQSWCKTPSPHSTLARPVTAGGRGGHPLLVGSDLVAEIAAFAPDQPLRDLMRRHQNSILDVTIADDPGPFLDVDTREQLELIESLLKP
jgi:CTP:molybdopterin cytidylyltransferase MocA